MKRKIALLLAALTLASTFTGCSGTEKETGGKKEEEPAAEYKVCMILTGGKLGDQASNDNIYAGIKAFADGSGAKFDAVELAEVSDVDMTVRTMIADGYQLFVFANADASDQMDTLCPEFPDVTFIMNNGTNNGDYANLTNVNQNPSSAAFLCGVFAMKMTESLTGELKAGYIGGVRNPNLERARYGMQAAASMLNGELKAVYVGNFTDAAAAKEMAQQMHNEGVRVIQAWAGGANKGVFEAAETAGEGYYSMGGATGQFHMSDTIIASLANRADETYQMLCKQAYEGTLESGNFISSVANGLTDCVFAPDSRADVIPESVADVVEEYRQKIISGEIVVPNTEEEYADFVSKLG